MMVIFIRERKIFVRMESTRTAAEKTGPKERDVRLPLKERGEHVLIH
jgi:hypothetical protein